MLQSFGAIGLFLVVAVGFALTTVTLPILLRRYKIVPHKPGAVKNSAFECGMPTIGKTWVRFNFRYYYYALIFLAFDVLVVFVYPWASDIRNLGKPAFIVMLVFIALIITGYVYAWKKKVLEWK